VSPRPPAALLRLVQAADQGWQDVRSLQVEVVGSVELVGFAEMNAVPYSFDAPIPASSDSSRIGCSTNFG
jgi:hypothetical protein